MAYIRTSAKNTFSHTCPLLVHFEPTNNIVPNTCVAIVAGVYVASPLVKNFATINLAAAAAAHPLQNCRVDYSQIQMEPQHAITYNNSNTNKKVINRRKKRSVVYWYSIQLPLHRGGYVSDSQPQLRAMHGVCVCVCFTFVINNYPPVAALGSFK
jgi:hypothetical protein